MLCTASVRFLGEQSSIYGKHSSSSSTEDFFHHTYHSKYHHDLWDNVREHFSLNHHEDNPAVAAQIHWFKENPIYFQRICERARPYLYFIYQQTRKRHEPTELVLLPMIESAYNPFVTSNVGAAGLWQIMPTTANGYGLKHNWWYDGRRDVYSSTNAALNYLVYLKHFFDGNWLLAIAAYDSGEGTVYDAMRRNAKHNLPEKFWNLHLPQETRAYVPRLLAVATIISNPSRYGIKLPYIKDAPYFENINVGSQIDLAHAARLAGISISQMYILNPGYNRWATSPSGSHTLLIPVSHAREFKRRLAKLPKSARVTWRRHVVQSGDTLSEIAIHYATSIRLLRTINKLKNDTIRLGRTLFIPLMHKAESTSKKYNHLYHIPKYFTHNIHHHLVWYKRYHRVQRGDSLWKIAKHNGISIKKLRHWNHFSSHHVIKPGDKVLIWKISRPAHSYAERKAYHEHMHHKQAQTKHHKTPESILPRAYKVVGGDTLSAIAARYHVSVASIKHENGLATNMLQIGQVLDLPSEQGQLTKHRYVVKDGDNIALIAKHFATTIHNIITHNHLKHVAVKPKQVLIIPKRKKQS